MNKIQLTKEGFEKLQVEYRDLTEKKRPYTVEQLQKARAMGDLAENSAYSSGKEELALVEGRIRELDEILKNVEIVEFSSDTSQVHVGSKVTVEINGSSTIFQIVGEFEADPTQQKLSQSSPIGKALLGKKVGESVQITIPAGTIIYKILDIA